MMTHKTMFDTGTFKCLRLAITLFCNEVAHAVDLWADQVHTDSTIQQETSRLLGQRYDGEYADLIRVFLADLRQRAGERFTYTYNHFVGWEHEVRVEAVGPGRLRCCYPRCIGGQHPCPPEWCSGPEALDEIRGELLGLIRELSDQNRFAS
ncbi:MAG: IS1096 element passenger TnpR family protein [Janthinobacterium lividum]